MHYRVLLLILLCATPLAADVYKRQPGIDVLHYDIALELSDSSDSIAGTTRIQLKLLAEKASRLWLDFEGMKIDSFQVAGEEVPYKHQKGRLSFDLKQPDRQRDIFLIEIRYHGTPGKRGLLITRNKQGHRVFLAENWPDNAHRWFPSVDHPYDKATVDFAITAPEKYEVVANGRRVEAKALGDGRKLTRWREGVPIPTYCMVFAVAEFAVSNLDDESGTPLSVFAYPQDSHAAALKFARTPAIVRFFADLVGDFPYEKLAQLETTTRIGGMENASAIFYMEESFKHNPVTEAPVPHEIAHQWFGDSLTMADWDHLWLSEGFATYLDALFYEHVDGQEALKRIMAQAAEAVMTYHKKRPAPIINPAIKDPVKMLNAYNYQKGAWVLHMLRKMAGDRAFFEGLRNYYQKHRDGNVMTEDFRRDMESATGLQLAAYFRQWLHQPGWPQYAVSWQYQEKTQEVMLTVRQTQKTGLFDMPLDVVIRSESTLPIQTVRVSKAMQIFRIPCPTKPSAIQIDPDNWVLKTVKHIDD
jgi:aminopeptidase N